VFNYVSVNQMIKFECIIIVDLKIFTMMPLICGLQQLRSKSSRLEHLHLGLDVGKHVQHVPISAEAQVKH